MSPFASILKRAVEATPNAIGGAFADSEGEMVDSFSTIDAHDWAVLTAHYGVVLSQMTAAFGTLHFGGPEYFVAQHKSLEVIVHAVDDGYYALLAFSAPPPIGARARSLARCGDRAPQGDGVTRARISSRWRDRHGRAPRRQRRPPSSADYDPRSSAWNGMAQFVGLAEGMGFEVTPVTSLEWSDLSADDILFLIYPLQHVDPGRLGNFVQAGGNVVIADDFGNGTDAMTGLGSFRADERPPRASRYYDGRLWAPIATARSDHPVGQDVGEVVTNHPAALDDVKGATTVVGFEEGALVVAGERGTGRFVAVSDPSIFINRMQQEPFHGNVQLAANILRWLDRHETGKPARHIFLLRGDVPMYGDPRPFIDDPHGGKLGRSIAELNSWLSDLDSWLLTANAMKAVAAALAVLLLLLAFVALPIRRGPRIDGAWLKFSRPPRRDEPHGLVALAERGRVDTTGLGPLTRSRGYGSLLVLAAILRDQVQVQLAGVTGKPEPLYTVPEAELVALVSAAKGTQAGVALARVYRRLRALPSRGQAAAPWSAGSLSRRDFEALYTDVAELCRTLGHELVEAREVV